jgi:hypothetical protein
LCPKAWWLSMGAALLSIVINIITRLCTHNVDYSKISDRQSIIQTARLAAVSALVPEGVSCLIRRQVHWFVFRFDQSLACPVLMGWSERSCWASRFGPHAIVQNACSDEIRR